MIGVVGPPDSVALVCEVADEMGRRDQVLPRTYSDPRDAGDIFERLRGYCDVVLFTGLVPYAIARRRVAGRSDRGDGPELQVVPHSGADLYRLIAQVLRETGGRFPTTSIDALDRATVERVFRDLALPAPSVVFEVDDHDGDLAYTSSGDWAAAHAREQDEGRAEMALTCLASTYEALREQGRPVRRIEHTRVTVATALDRALLTSRLSQSRTSQIAVILVQVVAGAPTQLTLGPARSKELIAAQRLLVEAATKLRAQLSQRDVSTYVITTTLGVVEAELLRDRAGYASLAAILATSPEVRVGIGAGATFLAAQVGAEEALRATSAALPAALLAADGSLRAIEALVTEPVPASTAYDQAVMALADQLGVGTQSLRRLLHAIRSVDSDAVTARQLSDAYGIQPRSARRLLRALTAAGYADEVGRRSGPRTGRPQTVFAVDLPGLSHALGAL